MTRGEIAARRTAAAVALALAVSAAPLARDTYDDNLRRWRADREAALTADDGWLTVAGLFWLRPGLNRAGADPSNDIVLPAGAAPARLGAFQLSDGVATFTAEPGTSVTSGGRPIETLALTAGSEAPAVEVGRLTMFLIKRGDRYAVRMRDRDSPMRRAFTTLAWYPVDRASRVTGRFTAYAEPKTIPVPNVLGDTPEMVSPGFVEFTLGGESLRLEPVFETSDARELFYIFGDRTNGDTTYHAGRFFYSELPENGHVVLDFNKAYNPPCVFTAFATCPLPPPQNTLPVRIEAGELMYGKH